MSQSTKIKDLVRDKEAVFVEYHDGNLWYRIEGNDFNFPIPIEDTKGAVFHARVKAIRLMRWVRKHVDLINEG